MAKNYKFIFISIALIIFLFFLWYFRTIVAYILISAVITLIGSPLVKLLSGIKIWKLKINRGISAAITLVLFWFLAISFFSFVIPRIANEAHKFSSIDVNSVINSFQEPVSKIKTFSAKAGLFNKEEQTFEQYITGKFKSILNISYLSDFFGAITGVLGDIFIAVFSISFITFFFLKEDKSLHRMILLLVPSNVEEKTTHALDSINSLLKRYFIGIIIEVTLIMTLATIGLSILGLDINTVIVIALFVGIMNVIPYIGPMIGAVFGIVIGVAANIEMPFYTDILPLIGYMALVFGTIQIIDNIFFQPLIYASSVKAHPLEIFIVIMLAGSIAGITGMVLAIPSYTILRIIAKEFFNNFKIVKKLTENI